MSTSTPEELFSGDPTALAIVAAVTRALGDATFETRTTRSQLAFRRRRGFAYLWPPGKYVASSVPVVLSLALGRRLDSARFKQVVHPAPGTWMHHLELRTVEEVDAEVAALLAQAYAEAG